MNPKTYDPGRISALNGGIFAITLIIVLAPTVGSMATGQSASDKFLLRLVYFIIIAGYSWLAVTVFDGFWKSRPARALEA